MATKGLVALSGHPGGVDVMNRRLLALHFQVQQLGLRFGVMFNSELNTSYRSPATPANDQQYHDEMMAYVQAYMATDGISEDDFISESWYTYPRKILDENTPNTFAAAALEGIGIFRAATGLTAAARNPASNPPAATAPPPATSTPPAASTPPVAATTPPPATPVAPAVP